MTTAHDAAAPLPPDTVAFALDIGRTHCRIIDHRRRATAVIDSGLSLSDPDGADAVAQLVGDAIAAWTRGCDTGSPAVAGIGVATSGAVANGQASATLLAHLTRAHPSAAVLVTGDVVAAHAGALAGRPGVIGIAGTGAVALGIDADGAHVVVDGHGPWLGDDGSGFSVGRAGLRAALAHHANRPGGSARLADAARTAFGPLDRLPSTVHSSSTAARDIASFAPAVAAAARAGDHVADDIWSAAATALSTTIIHALDMTDTARLSLLGGLFDLNDLVTDRVLAAVTDHDPGLVVVPAAEDAVAGVLALLTSPDEIHESLVVRAPPVTPIATPVAAVASLHTRGEAS